MDNIPSSSMMESQTRSVDASDTQILAIELDNAHTTSDQTSGYDDTSAMKEDGKDNDQHRAMNLQIQPTPQPIDKSGASAAISCARLLRSSSYDPRSSVDGDRQVRYQKFKERPDILPPSHQPFFLQMQAFCQRWAIWAATIDDPVRRKEILQCVTDKMLEAWKFGVLNGHYHMGLVEAAEKARLVKQSKSERAKDRPRAIASFATEPNVTKYYHIVNAELDKAGVTMEDIHRRIECEDLKQGEVLLELMQDRLDRDIGIDDWKPDTGRLPFRAHVHTRNLFMYALWEAQQCRKQIANSEQKLTEKVTLHQRKNLNQRIDVGRLRALQHLALAVEINMKEPVNLEENLDGDESGETESLIELDQEDLEETESGYQPGMPTSSLALVGDKEVSANLRQMAANMEEGAQLNFEDLTDLDITQGLFDTTTPPENLISDTWTESDDLPMLPAISDEMEALLTIKDKKRLLEDDSGTIHRDQLKRQKTADDIFDVESNASSILFASEPSYLHVPASLLHHVEDQPPDLGRRQFSRFDDANTTQLMPLTRPQNSEPRSLHTKQVYLAEVWTPKMNALLQRYGRPPLQQHIASWSDVRNILTNLGLDVLQRNIYLREYKTGLNNQQFDVEPNVGIANTSYPLQFGQAHQSKKLILRMPEQPRQTAQVDEFSDLFVNETRGFAFRCLPQASPEQRARLDDIVNEYVSNMVTSRIARHGTYVVIHDPQHGARMPIAHGFWNTKDKERPNGADWFYAGEATPRDFENCALHLHDFDNLPPKTPGKSSRRLMSRFSSQVQQGQQDEQQSKIQRHLRASKSGGQSQSYAQRRARKSNFDTFDDSDGSEYDPNAQ